LQLEGYPKTSWRLRPANPGPWAGTQRGPDQGRPGGVSGPPPAGAGLLTLTCGAEGLILVRGVARFKSGAALAFALGIGAELRRFLRPIGADSPTGRQAGNAQAWIEGFFGRGANTSRSRINTWARAGCVNNEPWHNRRSVMSRCNDGDICVCMMAGYVLNTRVGGRPRRPATWPEWSPS